MRVTQWRWLVGRVLSIVRIWVLGKPARTTELDPNASIAQSRLTTVHRVSKVWGLATIHLLRLVNGLWWMLEKLLLVNSSWVLLL